MGKLKKRTAKKKRWQFCYCDEDSPPRNGDAHDWKSRTYVADTFELAMDKMLKFVRSRPYVCLVDYECCALHVNYDEDNHEATFPRIDTTEHELSEYCD